MRRGAYHTAGGFILLALAGCASPPLRLYTLSDEAPTLPPAPLGDHPKVIEIARVVIPDELDTDDIMMRNNNVLQRSTKGRWASRLSLEITALITRRLAEAHPSDLVTNVHQPATPAVRVLITISTLDVTSDGRAKLTADWLVIPQDPRAALLRDRGQFSLSSPVGTDGDVVSMETALVKDLASEIRFP